MPAWIYKLIMGLTVKPENFKKVLFIVIGILMFLLLMLMPGLMLLAIPFSEPVENDIYMQIAEELNEEMEKVGPRENVLPWKPLDYKYLIAIDAVRLNQDFKKMNEAEIRKIANEFKVLVFDHWEWRTDSEGNRYRVAIYRYSTFDDVLERLFDEEDERELAKIYATFDVYSYEKEGVNEGEQEYSPDLGELNEQDFLWPLPKNYKRISSKFGPRIHPITGRRSNHKGIDLPAPTGTKVYAPADGVVVRRHTSVAEGKRLVIRHANNVETVYCHLHGYHVKVGDRVKRGQVIAIVGNTGAFTTGSHLHFEIHVNGKPVNPMNFY